MLTVDVARDPEGPELLHAPDDNIVESRVRVNFLSAGIDGAVQHHAFFDGVLPAEQQIDRFVQGIRTDFGEVAECPEMDAKEGQLPLQHNLGCPKQRAVAAQHESRLAAWRKVLARVGYIAALPL